jgi:Leucine-rich repeat (LRR) protein
MRKKPSTIACALAASLCLALTGCKGITDFLGITKDDPQDKVFANYETKIPNANLRASIAEAVGTPFGQMTVGQLESIEWLDSKQRAIPSLEGIQYCKNMQWINMYDSGISDISALSQLTTLKGCYMAANDIASVDPFLMSKGLNYLYLIDNPISVTELRKISYYNFPSLKGLQVTSKDPDTETYRFVPDEVKSLLASQAGLEALGMEHFQMGDAGFASLYTALLANKTATFKELRFVDDQLTDDSLPSAAKMTNLKVLVFGQNELTDISALSGMKTIQNLGLWRNKLTDLAPIQQMYDAGSFREQGAHVDFGGMNDSLELGTESVRGLANQAVIDFMIGHGVAMNYNG